MGLQDVEFYLSPEPIFLTSILHSLLFMHLSLLHERMITGKELIVLCFAKFQSVRTAKLSSSVVSTPM